MASCNMFATYSSADRTPCVERKAESLDSYPSCSTENPTTLPCGRQWMILAHLPRQSNRDNMTDHLSGTRPEKVAEWPSIL